MSLKKQNTPATQAEINQAIESIVTARIGLIMNQPFWGSIATRLQLVNAEEWCPTAATEGRHLYFNPKFVNMLKPKEVVFLVGHELLHAVYDHVGEFTRLNGRDAKLWNIAADYSVNQDLVEYRIGERIVTVPCLYDKKYHGMVVEEIYDDLMKNATKISIDQLAEMMLDEHLDGSGDDTGEGEDGSGRPKLTPEEMQQIKDEMKESILSAAQAVGVGNVPAGIRRMIKELTEPEMDWRQILQQQIESQVKNDFTYMRPSRKGWNCDAVLPSMNHEPAVECTVALDLSGSIGEVEMKDFMSELMGICQQHQSYKITLLTWGTKCYYSGTFTEDDGDDAIINAELKGGGGTSPACIWKWCEENDHDPKQLVIITDGFVDSWANQYADRYPTLWLVHKSDAVATHGMTVKFGNKH
jgi:predicted metal-dependent peptidase